VLTPQSVESRDVNKRDGTRFTIYDVAMSDGITYGTTKRQIAESAFELIGTPAEVRYSVKVNGDFTNYYLNGITMASGDASAALQRAQDAQPQGGTANSIPQAGERLTERDKSIHRQTAAKVAAKLHVASPGSATDFWDNCRKLSEYFDTGEFPSWGVDQPQDDDIPF